MKTFLLLTTILSTCFAFETEIFQQRLISIKAQFDKIYQILDQHPKATGQYQIDLTDLKLRLISVDIKSTDHFLVSDDGKRKLFKINREENTVTYDYLLYEQLLSAKDNALIEKLAVQAVFKLAGTDISISKVEEILQSYEKVKEESNDNEIVSTLINKKTDSKIQFVTNKSASTVSINITRGTGLKETVKTVSKKGLEQSLTSSLYRELKSANVFPMINKLWGTEEGRYVLAGIAITQATAMISTALAYSGHCRKQNKKSFLVAKKAWEDENLEAYWAERFKTLTERYEKSSDGFDGVYYGYSNNGDYIKYCTSTVMNYLTYEQGSNWRPHDYICATGKWKTEKKSDAYEKATGNKIGDYDYCQDNPRGNQSSDQVSKTSRLRNKLVGVNLLIPALFVGYHVLDLAIVTPYNLAKTSVQNAQYRKAHRKILRAFQTKREVKISNKQYYRVLDLIDHL